MVTPHRPSAVVGPGRTPDITVLTVTYNSAGVIVDFLASLHDALEGVASASVVVVDNASSDGTPDLVRRIAPWAEVVEAGGNLGYSAGVNIGLRTRRPAQGAYVLNPDSRPAPGSVSLLAAACRRDDVGIAVPRIEDPEGRLMLSLRREPTIGRAIGETVLGGHRAGRFRPLGEIVVDPAMYRDGARADWATGAAMFVARRALDAAGPWDERFFLYSEETDYALRCRDRGLHLVLVDAARCVHIGGDLAVSPALWALMAVNRTRLYRKRHGVVASAFYWCVVLANEAIRALLGRRRSRAALAALLAEGGPPGRRGRALSRQA